MMSKREKVIKGLEICSEHGSWHGLDCEHNEAYKDCPYRGCETGCVVTIAKDALALLKEQENKIEIPDVSIPEQFWPVMQHDPADDVVACTSCLICGTDVPLKRYESGPRVCSKCKEAVLAAKKGV